MRLIGVEKGIIGGEERGNGMVGVGEMGWSEEGKNAERMKS